MMDRGVPVLRFRCRGRVTLFDDDITNDERLLRVLDDMPLMRLVVVVDDKHRIVVDVGAVA
jgi:hypothetical protein